MATALSWQGIDIQGAATAVAISGAGTLTLGTSGINIASGGQNLTFTNTVTLGSNQTFTVGSGRTLSFNQASNVALSSASAVNLICTGAGTISMAGTNAGFNSGGTVTFSGGITWQMSTANSTATALWFGASGSAGSGAVVTFDNATLKSSSSTSRFLNNNVVVKTGGLTIGASGTSAVNFYGAMDLNAGTTANTTITTNAALTENGVISNGGFKKAGSSSLKLMGTNTYSGGTDLSAGTLYLGNNSALGGGTLTISAAATVATDSTTARVLSNAVSLTSTSAATFGDGTGTANLTFGALALSDAGGSRTISVANAAQTVNFSGVVSGTSVATLTKQGAGTLYLSGTSNTYAATTVAITAGTLEVAALNGLGGANLTMAGSTSSATLQGDGAITIASGKTITVGNSTTPASAAIFKNGGAAATTFEIAAKITPGAGATGPVQIAAPTTSGAIVRLSNDANDFGALTLASGILEFTSVANGGSASALGKDSGAYALANGSSGLTLRYVGTAATTTNRALDWQGTTGGLTLENTGSASVQYLSTATLKSGAGAATLTLGGTNTGSNVLAQLVSDNSTNAVSVFKSGAGSWKLTNASNSFSGKITAVGGDLQLETLSNGAAIAYNGGWVSYVGANSSSSDRLLQLGTVGGNATARLRNNGAGALDMTATGDITQVGGITAGAVLLGGSNTGDNYFRSRIIDLNSVSVGLTKSDAGKWILTAANTYTGATSVSGGTLRVDGSLSASSSVSVSSGATLAGKGTVGGAVTVASGGLVTAGDGSLGTLTVGSLAFSGTGTINIGNFGNYASSAALAVTSLSASGAAGSVTINVGGTSANNGTYNLLSYTGSIGGTGASAFVLGTKPSQSTRQTSSLVDTGSVLQYVVSGATPYWTGLQSNEWSTATIGGASNWKLDTNDNVTDFQAGDVVAFNDKAAATTADISVADISPTSILVSGSNNFTFTGSRGIVGSSTALTMSGSGTLTINTANSFAGGATLTSGKIVMGTATALGSGAVTLNGGTLDINGLSIANGITLGGGTLISGGATIGGAIVDGLATTLTVDSSLTLTGVNTYTGATTLTNGTLEIGGAGQLGGGNYAGNIANAGTLKFNTTAAQTASGVISGAGALVKDSTGTLTLTGVSTFTGATTIANGTLEIGGAGQLGSGTYAQAIGNAGTLKFNSTANQTLSGVISGAGGLVKASSGTLTLTAVNTFTGGLSITGGTLEVGGAGQLGSGTYAQGIANAGTLKFNSTASQTLSGVISGTGALVKDGTGTLTLTGVSTYTGDTTLTAGTLTIGGSGQLGSGTYSGVISGAGALVKSSSASQTLSGNNSYSGGTTISAGTLTLGHANALGGVAGGLVTVNTGATLDLGSVAANIKGIVLSGTGTVTNTSASAGKLTLGSGGIDMSAATANLTLSGTGFGIAANGAQTWNIASGRTLTITPGNTAGNFSGTGKVTVQGAGLVVLSTAANAYTGFAGGWQIDSGVEVRSGILNGSATGAAAWGTQALILNGGTASFGTAVGDNAYSGWSNAITVSANSTIKQYSSGTRRQLLTGAITASAGTVLTFENAGGMDASGATGFMLGNDNANFRGTINVGNGGSTTVGLILGGNDSQNGTAGTTGNLASDAIVDLRNGVGKSVLSLSHASGAWTFGAKIQGAGTVIVGALGTSTQTVLVSGANAYTGSTTVKTGTLKLGNAAALGTADAGTTVNSGAVLDLNGQSVVAAEALTISGAGIASGGALINTSASAATFAGLLTLAADTTVVASSGDITLSGTGAWSGNGYGLTVTGAGNTTIAGNIATANGTLTKRGAGSLTLTGASTYTGITTVENGTLTLAGGNNRLATTGSVALGAAGTSGKLVLGNASGVANQTLAGLSFAGNGGSVVGGNAAVSTLTLDLVGSTELGVFLGGSGTNENNVALVKSGSGTLTLSGASTHSGGTTVAGGTLVINQSSAVGAGGTTVTGGTLAIKRDSGLGSGTLTLAGGSIDNTSGAALALAGNNTQVWSGDFAFVGSADLDLGTGGVTLSGNRQLTVSASNLTVGGVISGDWSLTKLGTGTLTLNGVNLYTGGTTLSAGKIIISNDHALGTGSVSVLSGAILDLAGHDLAGNTINVATGGSVINLASSAASLNVGSGYALDSSTASFAGTVSLAAGTMTVAADNALGSSATVSIADGASIDLAGRSLGAGTLRLSGTGDLINPGALLNSSTSSAASHAGAIILDSNVTIGGAGAVVLGGGISGSGKSLEKVGAGTLTLSGANTYDGDTNVAEGKLVINGSIQGALNVAAGAILGGSGTIGGNAVISGTHSPGNSPGVETFLQDLSYVGGASITWELSANTQTQGTPVVFDQVVVGGNLSFTGATLLTLRFDGTVLGVDPVDWTNEFWSQSHVWTLFSVGGTITGGDNLLVDDISGLPYNDSLGHAFADVRNNMRFALLVNNSTVQLSYSAIPEPSTYGLVLGGLALAAAAARRRRNASSKA